MPNRTLKIARDTVAGTFNDIVQTPARLISASTQAIPGPRIPAPGPEYAARIASDDLPTLQAVAGVKSKPKRSAFYGGR